VYIDSKNKNEIWEYYTKGEVEKMVEVVHQEMIKSNEKEIRGDIANKGKYIGNVKVILHKDEFKKFKENEILVCSMTRPEFLPLMQKASAFITDEGGITCHAAIIARELKKPCIIGTKMATQVLKDGDLVEVDADNGVVRILEQVEPITTLKEKVSAPEFQDIVKRATVLTARNSSLQRELLFGLSYRNNPFCSIKFIITLLKS
jgi:phosphoenolpyruvate synthase/pyruvate phosphate dikinase